MRVLQFIVAHAAEAQPIIQGLRLRRVPAADAPGQRCFRGTAASLSICGQGAAAAQRAARALMQPPRAQANAIWCNFGVAGSGEYAGGTLVQANTVVDATDDATADAVWPLTGPRLAGPLHGLPQTVVRTVAEPETRYAESGVYDMEAAGIARIPGFECRRFVCLKLVVDGPDLAVHELGLPQLRARLRAAAPALLAAIGLLLAGDFAPLNPAAFPRA